MKRCFPPERARRLFGASVRRLNPPLPVVTASALAVVLLLPTPAHAGFITSLVADDGMSATVGRDPFLSRADRGVEYHAANEPHGFAAAVSERGLVLETGEGDWRLTFLGYGDAEAPAGGGEVAPTINANRVEYRRGPLTEWYVNGPLGLEQGFTVHEPIEPGATELSLRLKMGGSLAAVVDADGRGLTLHPADGPGSFHFGGLVAFDASGRGLETRMRVDDDELVYTVDVADARYPVVIDPQFTGGPSVRVNPNVEIEFKWVTDVAWFGRVDVFDNPDGTGTQLLTRRDEDPAGQPIAAFEHTVTVPFFPPLAADTGFFFRIRSTDPTGNDPDLVTLTPLPPFFTGAQELFDLTVESITNTSATISWNANVIGFGQVEFGTSMLDDMLSDSLNVTDHSLLLTGLMPGATYDFRVSNLHAIDGDALASQIGSFTTLGTAAAVPEPSSLALLGCGVATLWGFGWRRRVSRWLFLRQPEVC